ncbi:MAG: CBS domain-containing protein [Deltaproteobacteria bacterium]|nr:MAG: CBS domain-containing protein [Deltaproteobacteria bacterium]
MPDESCVAAVESRTVRSVMRAEFVAVEPEESLLTATRLMRLARLRHLLVVRRGVLVGVVSHRDVIESLLEDLEADRTTTRAEVLGASPVERIMRSPPDAVSEDCSLQQAAERMLQLRIGCLPVVVGARDGPHVVGLLTESDLLRAAYIGRCS